MRKLLSLALVWLFAAACTPPPASDDLFSEAPKEPPPPNQLPIVGHACDTNLTQDVAFSCSLDFIDFDGEEGAEVTWGTGSGTTCGAWLTFTAATATIDALPIDDAVGTCNLSVTLTDEDGGTSTELIEINVANVAPTLTIADAANITENDPETEIHADANVEASEEGFGVYDFDHAGTSNPKCVNNGTLGIDESTGAITFRPSNGYNGTCNIKVQFDDENETDNLVSDEFQIVVDPLNTAPSISASCSAADLNQDSAYPNCVPSVTDPDSGQTQTWSFATGHTCAWASINSSTGQITGTPDDDDVGSCDINFKSNDGFADSNVLSFTINILNIQPTLTIADAGGIVMNSPATEIRADGDVEADEESFGVYSFDHSTTTVPKCDDNGTLSIDTSTGAVTYTPATSYTGTCNIKVVFDDENATNNTVSDEFQIQVFNNVVPVISGSCTTSLNQDVAYNCTPSVVDPDPQTQTWSFDGGHSCGAWMSINSSTGEIAGTPDDDDVGICTLRFKSNDGVADSNILSFVVTVDNVQPTLTIADAANVLEDSPATEIRNDAAVAADEEGFGVYSFDHATTTVPKCTDNGTLAINSTTGAVTYTPATSFTGTCNIRVLFDDENASNNTVTDEFQVTVIANTAPVASASCATTRNQDQAYSCTPGVTDPDTGQTQTWSFTGTHDCSWLSINSSTGAVTGTPDDDDVGNCTLEFKVNDGVDDSNLLNFAITVNNVQPTLTIADAADLEADSPATVIRSDAQVAASDEGFGLYSFDHATTTVPKCNDNGSLSINIANGEVTYTPTTSYTGTCNIKVVFDDQNATNNTVSDEFQITVADTTPPGAFTISGTTGNTDVTADALLESTILPTAVWLNASGADNYDVTIKDSTGTLDICSTTNTSSTNLTFSSCPLVDSTSYRIYVTAFDAAGNSTVATNDGFQFSVYDITDGLAFVQSNQTTNSTNVGQATSFPLQWNLTEYDTSTYSYDSANPQELVVEVAGDYFVSVTVPMTTVTQRGAVRAEVFVNGTATDGGRCQSTYVRNSSGHDNATCHITALLTGLAVDDVITVETIASGVGTTATIPTQATMYVEQVAASRTLFYATTNATTNAANLNQSSAVNLQWESVVKDSGFTHSNGASPNEITVDAAGDYLIYFNVPLSGTATRSNVEFRVKAEGTLIPGGHAKQNYIRQSGHAQSSAHWAGLAVGLSAGDKITIESIQEAAAGTVNVQSGTKGNLLIEKVSANSNFYYGRGTTVQGGSTNFNPSTATAIEWTTDDLVDTFVYTHSTSSNSHEVEVESDGDYLLVFNDSLTSTVQRGAPLVSVEVNGTPITGATTATHYIRASGGHNEASGNLVFLLRNLSANDKVTVTTVEDGLAGSVTADEDALLMLWRKQ